MYYIVFICSFFPPLYTNLYTFKRNNPLQHLLFSLLWLLFQGNKFIVTTCAAAPSPEPLEEQKQTVQLIFTNR